MDWDLKVLGKVKVIQNQVESISSRKHVGTRNAEHRRNMEGMDTSTMNTRDVGTRDVGTRDAACRIDMRRKNKATTNSVEDTPDLEIQVLDS